MYKIVFLFYIVVPSPPYNLQINSNGNSGYNVTVRFHSPKQPNGILRKFIVSEKMDVFILSETIPES